MLFGLSGFLKWQIVADESDIPFSRKVVAFVKQILHELLAPPTVAAVSFSNISLTVKMLLETSRLTKN